jgi:hypothetical protein
MSIKIDKSLFSPEELETYKALIAKATVDPEAGEREMEDEAPEFPPRRKRVVEDEEFTEEKEVDDTEKSCRTRKSADPALAAALNRLETLEKSLAMKEFTDIAKKYAVLGENEEELAKTLYDMKKSNEANYDAYISVLDKSLGLIEKSGIFSEIGKSGAGYGAAHGTLGKVESIASEIRKSNPEMTYEQSVAKAWENNPELIAEYDREYNGR